jgi:hypothetical protein
VSAPAERSEGSLKGVSARDRRKADTQSEIGRRQYKETEE